MTRSSVCRPRWLRTASRAIAVAATASFGSGCGDSDEVHPVRVPEEAPAGRSDFPEVAIVEEIRIGSRDDPDYGFTSIAAADQDEDGALVVLEALDRRIRLYDAEGHLLATMGGAGEGPGEFRDLLVVIGIRGDTIWAVEPLYRRFTLFSRTGRVLSARQFEPTFVPLPPSIPMGTFGRTTFHAVVVPWESLEGRGWITTSIELPYGAAERILTVSDRANDTVRVPRLLLDGTGAVLDTLGWFRRLPDETRPPTLIEVAGRRYQVPDPPPDRPLTILTRDGAFVVERRAATAREDATIRVTRLTLGEDTLFSRAYEYEPMPYLDAPLDSLARERAGGSIVAAYGEREIFTWSAGARGGDDAQRARAEAAIRGAMDFPPFQVPIREARAGEDGGLWLRRERSPDLLERWLVLHPDGELRGEVTLPEGAVVVWNDSRLVWTVETDDLGLPWLVRYRLEPS